jgi:hypothetical protein
MKASAQNDEVGKGRDVEPRVAMAPRPPTPALDGATDIAGVRALLTAWVGGCDEPSAEVWRHRAHYLPRRETWMDSDSNRHLFHLFPATGR